MHQETNHVSLDNGLLPGRRQAIIWINAEMLLISPLVTKFIEILIEILKTSVKKMHLKISSDKWCLFRIGLNELTGSLCPMHSLGKPNKTDSLPQ